MCGINGVYAYNTAASTPDRAELVATRDHMRARGPDGAGAWWNESGRVGLGHRRLSILDLSDRAAQPMIGAGGDTVVTFNGEIYNFPELRRDLEARGVVFRTTSDTEALLHLYDAHGPEMVTRLRGMFAFAIWDAKREGLFLARDLYGIKPLYTANDGWTFRFASQVKALLAGGKISRDPEPAGVVGFHLWGSVPEPFTLYRDIRQLPAGCTQWVDAAGPREPKPYGSIAAVFSHGAERPAPSEAVREIVRDGVRESVAAHLLSDVEVGVFLSAGVDSGALLGLMRDAGQGDIRAITLAFEEFRGTREDEAPIAGEIAKLYGAEHIVRVVSEREFRDDLPAILEAMDQPSIDGVNTWFVAKAAREAGLKVALSGLGGDEILAGYPSFRDVPRWVSLLKVPAAIPGLGRSARWLLDATGMTMRNPKAAGMLEFGGDFAGAYFLRRGLMLPHELRTVLDADVIRIGLRRLKLLSRIREAMTPTPRSAVATVATLESTNYLRNQLLRDADWAGMAHSLEIRTPLVDRELLTSLSSATPRLSPGEGKRALASAPSTPLPGAIVDRPKTGFGVPTGRWTVNAGAATVASKGAASRAWSGEVLERFLGAPAASRPSVAVAAG